MGTEKRDRQKANRAARLAAEQAAEARARRNRTIRNAVIAAVAIVAVMVLVSLLSGCGSGSDPGSAPAAGTGSDPVTYGTGPCPPTGGASGPKIDFDAAPERCIDPSKTYIAEVETTEGKVAVRLDTERTPVTANNFVVLARYGYFDGTDLFRTEADTGIIQGGSPHTQDNRDEGPGYTIPDEGTPFSAQDYGPGTIAMANSGQPDSASAQFFVLAGEGGRYLADPSVPGAGSYAVFGQVTEGLDVLKEIAALDDGTGSGTPSNKVAITHVTIAEA